MGRRRTNFFDFCVARRDVKIVLVSLHRKDAGIKHELLTDPLSEVNFERLKGGSTVGLVNL
jgi:hypothetical protein